MTGDRKKQQPSRVCGHPGCNNPARRRYCDDHASVRARLGIPDGTPLPQPSGERGMFTPGRGIAKNWGGTHKRDPDRIRKVAEPKRRRPQRIVSTGKVITDPTAGRKSLDADKR